MNRSERHISFDYSYFIAIAGIGGLFCCAALMVGFAYGQPSFGYYAASVVLVITAFILLMIIRKAISVRAVLAESLSSAKSENVGVAMLMTSPAGDVVYANKAAKTLFEKYEFGTPKSPLKIDVSNKNTIEDALGSLVVGKMKIIVSEIRDSGKYLKFEVEKVHKNGDFFSWRIFEDATADSPFNIGNTGLDQLEKIGHFFGNKKVGAHL